jgi:hypothetical protein
MSADTAAKETDMRIVHVHWQFAVKLVILKEADKL